MRNELEAMSTWDLKNRVICEVNDTVYSGKEEQIVRRKLMRVLNVLQQEPFIVVKGRNA